MSALINRSERPVIRHTDMGKKLRTVRSMAQDFMLQVDDAALTALTLLPDIDLDAPTADNILTLRKHLVTLCKDGILSRKIGKEAEIITVGIILYAFSKLPIAQE